MAGPTQLDFRKSASITKFGLLSIPQRRGAVAATVFGIAGVVAVLVGVLSIAAGFKQAMTVSGAPDAAIVLRSGADSEMVSGLGRDETRVIADSPGVAHTSQGPLASAELFVIINMPKRSTGTDANVPLRGVEASALQVRDKVKIVWAGCLNGARMRSSWAPAPSRNSPGSKWAQKSRWAGTNGRSSACFPPAAAWRNRKSGPTQKYCRRRINRGDSFQSVYVKFNSPGAFQEFKDSLTSNPQLSVKVVRQSEYYAEQSETMTRLITTLGVSDCVI